MKILVVNSGSSSLKYQLFNMHDMSVLAKGVCERIGAEGSCLKGKAKGQDFIVNCPLPTHTDAVNLVLQYLVNKTYGAIESIAEISAVGHRVVHSGETFTGTTMVDDSVIAAMRETYDIAPLHGPANLMGVIACREAMHDIPMALVFDTTFHTSTMPQYAYLYGLPIEIYEKWKIRKYGFHGTSHMYVSRQAAKYLNKDIADLKIVTCHLGNGASITAVDGGKSVDTSMGFTPLEGLMMGTRCGDIDPAAVEFLCRKEHMDITQAVQYLNKQSGLQGISGVGSDFRDLTAAESEGNTRAKLAIDMFSYRVKRYIGAYAAAMGGIDCVVFTAGIGEHTPVVRERSTAGLDFLGIKIDLEKNANVKRGATVDLTAEGARVKTLLIPTDEELVIAQETMRVVTDAENA